MQWLQAITENRMPRLVQGAHESPENGLCAMEMVAFMECLPHTDKPECTCPVLTGFTIATNDMLSDEERQKLLPILPELVDTVVNTKLMRERERFICDTAMRDFEYNYKRRSFEMDYERDRFRGCHYGSRQQQDIQELLSHGVIGAVKVMFMIHPPWHVADILIGMLRSAIRIGQPKPKSEFKKPARVKELVTVTYLPQAQRKATLFNPTHQTHVKTDWMIPHGMSVIDPKKAFMAIDCVA